MFGWFCVVLIVMLLALSHSFKFRNCIQQIALTRHLATAKDDVYMRLALRQAQHAFREREVPIGAVIVDDNGIILSSSRNQVEALQDVTLHAEMDCIRKASVLQKNWRLNNCTLYTTSEPCPMCLGAILASRIKRVVYGAKDGRIPSLRSWTDSITKNDPIHQVEVEGGVLQDESELLLKRFFQELRRTKGHKCSEDFESFLMKPSSD